MISYRIHPLGKLPVIILFYFLSGHSVVADAQDSYTAKDSTAIFSLLQDADRLTESSEFDGAMHAVEAALDLSRRKKIRSGEAYALLKKADLMYRRSEMRELLRYDSAALRIALRLKDPFLTALAYYQVGVAYMSNGNAQGADANFRKALAAKFENDQSAYTAAVYNDMGFNYGNMGQVDKQTEWYLRAVRVYEKVNDRAGLAQTLNNLSVVSNELGKRQDAIMYGRMAISIRETLQDKAALSISYSNMCQLYMAVDSLEQAIRCQELGLKYALMSGLKHRIAHSYISRALLLNRQRKNAEALEYEQKAIALLKEIGDSNTVARRYIAAGIGYSSIKDSVKAVEYFGEAEVLSRQLRNKYNLRDLYYHQAAFYKNRKDFEKAYASLKQYYAFRDSIINESTEKEITALQLQYATEKKDNEIMTLNAEQRISQLEIEKQKAIIAGNHAEALQRQQEIDLLSKSAELQAVKLLQQGEELEKQKLLARNREQELQLAEQEKQLRERQLLGQKQFRNLLIAVWAGLLLILIVLFNRYQLKKKLEQQKVLLEVRNNISRNLHDDIGASLSNINILNELTRRNVRDPEKAGAYLVRAGDDIQRISESLSDIVWNINPQYDDPDKLFVRMKRYAADMLEGKGISAELRFPEASEKIYMGMDQRRDFYLIFKEAVHNLVKYSGASEACIMVSRRGRSLELVVSDNGKGFEVDAQSKGNGILNMNQRAEKWGGVLRLESGPGQGTRLMLNMPLGHPKV